jgi:branched-subunit amino acid aminotransferase/4-amino-4-deoxychorismate lyase
MYSFLNNQFLPAEKTFVHVSDLAVQRGYGIFDFFKAVNGKIPFRMITSIGFIARLNLCSCRFRFRGKN